MILAYNWEKLKDEVAASKENEAEVSSAKENEDATKVCKFFFFIFIGWIFRNFFILDPSKWYKFKWN